jgi:hypothetical protein
VIDRTARILLSARRAKDQGDSLARRGLPFVSGITLLFVCGYCERYLRNDPSGHALRLLLIGLMCASAGLSAAFLSGTTREILRRTAVFPVSARSRFIFAGLGTLLNPVSVAFLLAGALSMGILYGESPLLRALSAANFMALLLVTQLCTIVALLFPVGRRRSVVFFSSMPLVVFVLSGVLSIFPGTPGWLPGPGWACQGILAAGRGDVTGALLHVSYLCATAILMGAAGRRFS